MSFPAPPPPPPTQNHNNNNQDSSSSIFASCSNKKANNNRLSFAENLLPSHKAALALHVKSSLDMANSNNNNNIVIKRSKTGHNNSSSNNNNSNSNSLCQDNDLLTNTALDDTLSGLQEVSDLLSESLLEFQKSRGKKVPGSVPPIPPPRTSASSSRHASPSRRKKSLVKKLCVDEIQQKTRKSPSPKPESSSNNNNLGSNSSNNNIGNSNSSNNSYYRSSIADKISDYEDIWPDSNTLPKASARPITPAESETQFKAYLHQKLESPGSTLGPLKSPRYTRRMAAQMGIEKSPQASMVAPPSTPVSSSTTMSSSCNSNSEVVMK